MKSETESDEFDPNTLSDDDLEEEIRARVDERDELTNHIRENDLTEAWERIRHRDSAIKHRNRLTAEADELRAILQKRRLTAIMPNAEIRGIVPDHHLDLMRQQTEISRIKEAGKTARMAILAPLEEARNRDRTRLFVKAASQMMDKEQFEAIWTKARELWPDSPAWQELPEPRAAALKARNHDR